MSDKVRDAYEIDFETLRSKAQDSDYWLKCYDFYRQVQDWSINHLTAKQEEWLKKIEEQLSE